MNASSLPRAAFGAAILALAAGTAAAQTAGPAGQASAPSAAQRVPIGVPAMPAATSTPFQPAVLETSEMRAPATDGLDPSRPAAVPPPAAANPFEAYVSGVAGKPLRRFGAELLVPEARDFSAPATTPVPGDYRINPGDQLQLGLSGSVQAQLRLTVDNEGRIFVPRVGAIMVAGTRYADLHSLVSRHIERQYREFKLEVTVAALKGLTVYVTGFAQRPGSYTVSSLSTLVNAVLAAGGPSAGGSFRSIQLKRDGRVVSDFDLYDLLLKGDNSAAASLENGDIIHVAPAGAQVGVIGSVNREAIFELGAGETVADAIAYAGGVSTVADETRLLVFNALGGTAGWQQLTTAEAATHAAKRGDIVRLLSNVGIARPLGEQPVLVTLSGEVRKPGHYYVQPGTRLEDVVNEAGGLTQHAFPYASVITRESVKEQQRVSFARAVDDMELLLSAQPLVSVNRAQMTSSANVALLDSVIEQMRRREPTGRLVFDLPVTTTALPADLIVENNDSIHVPSRPVTVGVFGAVPSPASFAYRSGMSIGDFLKAAGGVQQLGDKSEIFVVRANGTVLARGKRILGADALPGDLVFVSVDANRGEFWARLRDITGTLFGSLVSAASIKTIIE